MANSDLWPIIRALAAREPQCETLSGDVDCALCTASISIGEPHDSECPYRQARELLSAAPKPPE